MRGGKEVERAVVEDNLVEEYITFTNLLILKIMLALSIYISSPSHCWLVRVSILITSGGGSS